MAGQDLIFLSVAKFKSHRISSNFSQLDAPATDVATIHEVLVQSLKIKNTLKLKSIVVVFDQPRSSGNKERDLKILC